MGARTFISFVRLWGFGCERGLLLLYNLPKVEHGVKTKVHHLNGGEEDRHYSRVHACNHQASRKSLRGREKAMTASERKYKKNETMQSTLRSECLEIFDNSWQTVNPRKDIKLNTWLST